MSYFFDLEDYATTYKENCEYLSTIISNSVIAENTANKQEFFQQYNTYVGYTPTQETVYLNKDGSIDIFINYDRGKTPVDIGGYCCSTNLPYILQTLNTNIGIFPNTNFNQIYWDADKQECRWKQEPETCVLDSFKIVLNPVENDGALFNVDDGDKECSLAIDFDYLFKMDCQNLANILNPAMNTNADPKLLKQIKELQNSLLKVQSVCSQIESSIDIKTKEFLNTDYSILQCNTNKLFCIKEANGGLTQWQNILGPSRYKRFLDGIVDSYTCADVNALVQINNQLISDKQPIIIAECKTPFGYKSQLKIEIDEMVLEQNNCNENVDEIENEINSLLVQTDIPSTCTSPIEALETLDVAVTLDVVESDGSLTTVFETDLFPTIGSGNLYEYLKEHPFDSGFYLCGEPNADELWASGCTVLRYNDELTGPTAPFSFECGDIEIPADFHCNVMSCRIVKDAFLKGLHEQSGLSLSASDKNIFKASLSKEIFASKWLKYSTIIDDTNTLELIKNKKVKISLKINNTCANVCIYIDSIKLVRSCIDGNGESILISESPGFELDRIIDNKKSWIKNSERVNRTFDIANNQGGNVIRKTDYDVNDERLVINTKEIDLDINIASAIENDVQCYINDNLGLLDSVPSNDCGCSESLPCYEDVFEIITYEDALTSGLIPSPIDPEDFLTKSRAVRDAWLKAWNELMLATAPYLDLVNGVYTPQPSEDVMITYTQTRNAWRKALDKFNLASAGGFIEGLTIDEELLSTGEIEDYIQNTYNNYENLAPQMFNTKCGRILKVIGFDGFMYFVETPTKELKVYWANSDYGPRNKTWIDMTSFVQVDGGAYGGLTPVYTPEKASYFCKFLPSFNYQTWIQMMSFQYQTNGNTSHNQWVNPVEDSFYIEWDSVKGKCMTNMFNQVVPEQFSMHYPITSLNFWTSYGNNALGETAQCNVDVYIRNSGTTACTGVDFTWPNISVDIATLNTAYFNTNIKLSNETKLTERTPLYYLYLIDPNTNLVPDETSGYIPIKVTTTITKGSLGGDIVFKEEYVLNDSTSTCFYRYPSSDGLALVIVYIGITDPNCAYWDVNASQWDFSNVCTGSTEAGTYISGSTSTLPLAGASDNGVDRNWSFNENYYVHYDVKNNNTNQVYYVTNNDFNLKDKTLPIVCPTSASTQTFNITTALNSINTFKTTILGQIQEDLDNALGECTIC